MFFRLFKVAKPDFQTKAYTENKINKRGVALADSERAIGTRFYPRHLWETAGVLLRNCSQFKLQCKGFVFQNCLANLFSAFMMKFCNRMYR